MNSSSRSCVSSKWSRQLVPRGVLDALAVDHLVGGREDRPLDGRPHLGGGTLGHGMELLDGETGLQADPGVLGPLVRRAGAPCHPEDDQLPELRVERRVLHEHLVEGQPRLAEGKVMGEEAERPAASAAGRRPAGRARAGAGRWAARRGRRRPTPRSGAGTAGSQHRPAVDAEDLAGDVARLVGTQEHARGGDVVAGTRVARAGRVLAIASFDGRCPSAWAWCCIGVSMADGGMLFTVIPYGANSRASVFVSVMTPPFDAA